MKKTIVTLLATGYSLLVTLPAQAATGRVVNLRNPLGNTSDIPAVTGNIIRAILGLVGAVALLMFIYGGFLWLTSGGNPDKIKKGKETLVWAAIGLAFIFSSYIIANFVIRAITGRQ